MHNRRNQVATKPRPPRANKRQVARPAPGFPSEIAIPLHRGASPINMPHPQIALPARVAAQPLFALPEREPPERLRTPAKGKRRKAPAKRRKGAGKVRKDKAIAPGPDPTGGLAVFAMPRGDEPLVMPAPRPPQSRALAPIRPASLIGQIGLWLGARAEAVWQRLGGASDQNDAAELRRLRAENARLRDQLEALLALQQAAATSARDRAPLPFP